MGIGYLEYIRTSYFWRLRCFISVTLPFTSYMPTYSLAVIDDSLNITQRIPVTTKQMLCLKMTW
jgi:hypothetical protein